MGAAVMLLLSLRMIEMPVMPTTRCETFASRAIVLMSSLPKMHPAPPGDMSEVAVVDVVAPDLLLVGVALAHDAARLVARQARSLVAAQRALMVVAQALGVVALALPAQHQVAVVPLPPALQCVGVARSAAWIAMAIRQCRQDIRARQSVVLRAMSAMGRIARAAAHVPLHHAVVPSLPDLAP